MLSPYVPTLVLEWARRTPGDRRKRVEGTLVFVDLSGFTAMSERLSRLGKVGAEELMGVINSTFTELLSVAYSADGSLLKFGGDALLLFFSGLRHEVRGAWAAAEMRRTLRRIGTITTSAGVVRLRMSAGVHSGAFDFFLVGGPHRELIIAGPEATRTVDAESAAGAGEIILSRSTAKALEKRVLGSARGKGRLLIGSPRDPGLLREPAVVRAASAAKRFVPPAVRAHLLGGGQDPEHRLLTMAFVHFDGTDALISSCGVDEVASRLESVVIAAQTAAEEHEVAFLGTDIDRDGGKILLCAGAPRTAGDNEERMLRTLRAVVDGEPALALRIGVHRGYAFAGDVGPPYRRTYTVMGDVVNTAARVMARARTGEILATAVVLDATATQFETEPIEPFRAKGKSRPIIAHSIREPMKARADLEPSDLPLIGRTREMELLEAALDDLRLEGHGAAIHLRGDPGAGKSRLIRELHGMRAGERWLWMTGDQFQASIPFYSVAALLADVVGVDRSSGPAAARALRKRVGEVSSGLMRWLPLVAMALRVPMRATRLVDQLDQESRAAILRRAIQQILEARLGGPTVFVIEDAQWLDAPSRDLIEHLRSASDMPWLFLGASRTEPGTSGWSTITLEPLSREDSISLAHEASDALLPAQAASLADRSAGNPFLLLQLAFSALRGVDERSLPDTIEAVVAARIDKLSPRDRLALRRLSVLGTAVDRDLLSAVATALELPGAAAWRRLADFVERDAGLRFRQALYQQVAYEGLPFSRRVALHQRIAEVLERVDANPDRRASPLAFHFHRARNHQKSWHYSRVAARDSSAVFDRRGAASQLEQALEAASALPRVPAQEIRRAWTDLAGELRAMGQFAGAATALRRARALARRPVERGQLCFLDGGLRVASGKSAQGLRWYTRGLGELVGAYGVRGVSKTRNVLRLGAAGTRYSQGRYEDCILWCRIVLAKAAPSRDRVAMANAYNRLHLAYTALRDPERAKYGRKAVDLFGKIGALTEQGQALNNLGMDAYFDGDWQESLKLYRAGRDTLTRAGNVVQAAVASTNIAEILSDQGRLDEAQAVFTEALRTLRPAGSFFVPVTLSNLGRLAARAGRFEDADATLAQARADLSAAGAAVNVIETDTRIAESLVIQGRATEALEVIGRVTRLPAVLAPPLRRLRGYALVQSGDEDGARQAMTSSLEVARRTNARHEIGWTLEALGRLEHFSTGGGEAYAKEARDIFEDLGIISTPDVPLRAAR
jgi:class 3 adenylate cyclase/tetratricopeptide (TPR) repeat protein